MLATFPVPVLYLLHKGVKPDIRLATFRFYAPYRG